MRSEEKTKGAIEATEQKPLELHISFEGNAPGLSDQRLSIDAFAPALLRLLRAYRRIASGLLRDALDRPGYGERGGTYAEEAKGLDLELIRITHRSPVHLEFACTVRETGPQMMLFQNNGLLERAGLQLLDSIEAESHQQLRHARVREYLEVLPRELTRQKYELRRGHKAIKSVDLPTVVLAHAPEELPYLVNLEGEVAGVGFEPGPLEIRIKQDGSITTLSANSRQVEQALNLRHQRIRALAVRRKTFRLLRLERIDQPARIPQSEEIIADLDDRWGELLKRLAK